jgi:hypothetical protein
MIELFRDFGFDYWLTNKVVDCGKSNNFKQIKLNIDIQNNNTKYNTKNDKKLNNKYKQYNNDYNNETTYYNRYSKSTNRNTGAETLYNSDCNRLQYNRNKIKDIRINDLQKTSKYNSIYKYTSSDSNQKQMYKMQQNCQVYDNRSNKRKNVLDSFSKPNLICYNKT